jgi:hypothetical protein
VFPVRYELSSYILQEIQPSKSYYMKMCITNDEPFRLILNGWNNSSE